MLNEPPLASVSCRRIKIAFLTHRKEKLCSTLPVPYSYALPHRSEDSLSMTEMGQKHVLPHRNNSGRFTSISGHKRGELYLCWATLALPKGLPAVPNIRPM